MDVIDYIIQEALIIIPVLSVLGVFLKSTPKIPDWLIPWILLVVSIVAAQFIIGFGAEAFVQGVLCAGASVLGHQLVKQTVRKD
ncbi:MAG: phage holin family protein [Christensenellales bacterium]|jgi:hypothetical protein